MATTETFGRTIGLRHQTRPNIAANINNNNSINNNHNLNNFPGSGRLVIRLWLPAPPRRLRLPLGQGVQARRHQTFFFFLINYAPSSSSGSAA
ncbi:hypothetical protein L209DRAFT_475421 [Thermothelomyces heterothallicus CBS 203.75]